MKDFKELEVWKEAKRLVIMIYQLTKNTLVFYGLPFLLPRYGRPYE